jgi:hypothetical protein
MEFDDPVDRGHVAVGAVIMVLGLLFLMDRLSIFEHAVIGFFWPGVLVAWGMTRIIWPSRPGQEVGGLWIALVGGLLLLDQISVVRIGESWPVLVIVAGLVMMFRALDWLPPGGDRRSVHARRDPNGGAYVADGTRQ